MDLLIFLQDSTDDDSDDGEELDIKTTKNSSTALTSGSPDRRGKVRRRGCIDVIPSGIAQHLDIFSRSIPYRRGHWAGHVNIPILKLSPQSASSLSIDDCASLRKRQKDNVRTFRNLLERRGISGTLVEHDHLHLSLSKHFSLHSAQIDPFVRQLTNFVQQEYATSIHVESISASELKSMRNTGGSNDIILLNDEKTRSFLCWKVHQNPTLQRIIAHIDIVMKSYNQPTYYEPAKFHISIASFPGDILEKFDIDNTADSFNLRPFSSKDHVHETLSKVKNGGVSPLRTRTNDGFADENTDEEEESQDEIFVVPVYELRCKVGTTKEFVIPLRKRNGL